MKKTKPGASADAPGFVLSIEPTRKEVLYKMLSGGGSAGKIIMQKIHP